MVSNWSWNKNINYRWRGGADSKFNLKGVL